MSIPRPLRDLLNCLHITTSSEETIEVASKGTARIHTAIRLLSKEEHNGAFMSVSIEEGSWYQGMEHIVEVECLVHKAGILENIGGRMVMPSNSVYVTDFTYDPKLAVSIGVRSGLKTEILHVN